MSALNISTSKSTVSRTGIPENEKHELATTSEKSGDSEFLSITKLAAQTERSIPG